MFKKEGSAFKTFVSKWALHSRIKSLLLLLRVFVYPKVKKEVQIRYWNNIKHIKVISAVCTDDAATDKSWSHSSHFLLFGHAALQRRPVSSSVKVKKKKKVNFLKAAQTGRRENSQQGIKSVWQTEKSCGGGENLFTVHLMFQQPDRVSSLDFI